MKWLTDIKNWVVKTFFKSKSFLQKWLPIGIQFTNNFKKFADSPTADFLTAVIPGKIDDAAKMLIRENAPMILKKLYRWNNIVNINDPNIELKVIAAEFATLDKATRDDIKTRLAVEINKLFLNGEVSDADLKILTLLGYHHPDVIQDETAFPN